MKTSINDPIYLTNAGQKSLESSDQSRGSSTKKFVLVTAMMILGASQAPLFAQAPYILAQPSSRVVWAGANVKLSASTGSSGPTSWFWLYNSTNLPSGMFISTAAGNGSPGYSGDGGPATNASLNDPHGMMLDAAGNLFIADTSNNRIRKVGIDGNITTVAGNGTNGYSGDGGAATNASLNSPIGVVADASGNLFIADSLNSVIRKVDTNGLITTVAGNGTVGHSGDGSQATNASLYYTHGMAVDTAGNLFLSEGYNFDAGFGFIRKVNTNGIITTVAGNGTNIYINYSGNVGDGGPATNAFLTQPYGLAVDGSGNLLIADAGQGNDRVRKVNTNGIISTIAGTGNLGFSGDNGAASNATLASPLGVTVDNFGNLFIADAGNSRIRKVSTNGIITTVAGGGRYNLGDGGMATNATLNVPIGVAVDAAGNLFIADSYNHRIRRVNSPQWPNSQLATLSLNSVTTASAGNYQEVVTDPFGSITSNIASLIVASSPLIYQTALISNGSLALNFVSQPASTNVVLCATNLSPPVLWQSLSTNIAGADGDWQFTDTNTIPYPVKFYRSFTQ